jgi:hypothetical protein
VRLAVSRYASKGQPVSVKKAPVAKIKHLQAPIKGLSLNSTLVQNDALTASIIDNWIVEKDRISVRPGLRRVLALADPQPIESIVPWYGVPNTVAYAQAGSLFTSAGALLRAGFRSNEWAWTSFSNLGKADYTVAVNGRDGVWSWDGGSAVDAAAVTVTNLSKSNPAVVTVAAADIGKFHNDQMVKIVGEAWVDPGIFHLVLSHMNRLWFADAENLALYYLPLQQKSGQLKLLPLNALFRRGGSIVALYTWTLDGGAGTEDQLVVFSSNGEAVIYGGTDPDSDFALTGIFRFDSPLSRRSVINYGGDLYVMISTGLVPMSTMLRAESEMLGTADKNVTDMFWELIRHKRSVPGFAVILDYDAGWAICNIPSGAPNSYRQMVRFMPDPVWASWSGLPSRCWQWINSQMLIGSDDGVVYELTKDALSDDGKPIVADVQLTWSSYDSAAVKQFKMISPYIITDGAEPRPYVDIRVDYDTSPPFNQPDTSGGVSGAVWDVAIWDVDYWVSAPKARTLWNGVSAIGRVAAPRIKVSIVNCQFSLAGFDIVYELGAAVG